MSEKICEHCEKAGAKRELITIQRLLQEKSNKEIELYIQERLKVIQ